MVGAYWSTGTDAYISTHMIILLTLAFKDTYQIKT